MSLIRRLRGGYRPLVGAIHRPSHLLAYRPAQWSTDAKEHPTVITTGYVTGSPCWLDLGSPDTEASAAFYGAVFGWTFRPAGPDAGGYGVLHKDGRTVGAIGPLTEEGASGAWTVYFRTADADATARATELGGGRVRAGAFDVMEAGRTACLTDPFGAEFAVWQPAALQGLEAVTEEGTLTWAELFSPDPATAAAFYGDLFGWRREEVTLLGMAYSILSTAEGDQGAAAFGGIAPLQVEGQKPRWLPYFEVADPDAVARDTEENGGSVLVPPVDAPGVGRLGALADPFGAPFAVVHSPAAGD
ncbi:VOC family protein [Streptomyces sp. NPDC005408]|uniref:VOC family protein n=1 Tax=Streptomyces sp. NPDC005408 TaxID=3155341 RepID=UPI0033B1FB83